MLIQLPVETWIEILDWLKRRDFVKKLDSLWDREFTPIVQDWLHKYTRNVKIRHLWATDDGLSVYSCGRWELVPFADVELPENITSFEQIRIMYLYSTVLQFLRRMRPLFHNINFYRGYEEEALTQTHIAAFHALMPLFSSIESINFEYEFFHFFSANHSSTLLNAKLLRIWNYFVMDAATSEQLLNWLFTRRQDGQARTLVLDDCGNSVGFWEKLRERFLDPARQSASSFFIKMSIGLPNTSAIENVRTGEQLNANSVTPLGLISNCPLNVDREWLAKKEEEVLKWTFFKQQQAIWLDRLELGSLDP